MYRLISLLLQAGLLANLTAAVTWQVVSSSPRELVLRFDTDAQSPDDLKPVAVLVGLPTDAYPQLQASFEHRTSFPGNWEDLTYTGAAWVQKQLLRGLYTATLQISPYAGHGDYYRTATVVITFPAGEPAPAPVIRTQISFLKDRIVNWEVARRWFRSRSARRVGIREFPPGTWFRFYVTADGIRSLPAELFDEFGATLQGRDPAAFRLYTGSTLGRDRGHLVGSYGQPLPENLVEIALYFLGDDNDQFDGQDQLVFYARGAGGFDSPTNVLQYHQNLYFTQNAYWLLIPDAAAKSGRRVETFAGAVSNPQVVDYGIMHQHVETDQTNPYESGLLWVGSSFGRGTSQIITLDLPDPVPGQTAQVQVGVLGQGGSSLKLYLQNTQSWPLLSLNWSTQAVKTATQTLAGTSLVDGSNRFIFQNSSTGNALLYMDFLTLRYSRTLSTARLPFEFSSPVTGSAVRLQISGTTPPELWEFTHPQRPVRIPVTSQAGGFRAETVLPGDTLRRFVLFDPASIPPVTGLELAGSRSFSTLRNSGAGVDHLILGPARFASAAAELVTHRGQARFIALEDVYDEFAGGNPDPLAIRLFLQWTQEYWTGVQPSTVFLLGDGDYDYRNITGNSTTVIPTIEQGTSAGAWATDDQLAAIYGRIPELAIGRLPVHTAAEVETYAEKIIRFETSPLPGLWRNTVTLLADDGARPETVNSHGGISTGKSHTLNSESLLPYIAPAIIVDKLYMLEYPEVSSASTYGVVKPAATQAVLDKLQSGTAVINYIGHGSPHQLAQEGLLVQSRGDANLIDTGLKLPLWIVGTCSWGQFDQIGINSFPEELIRRPLNAAAAIITTTRPITVTSNADNIRKIFGAMFPNRTVTSSPVGTILQAAKVGSYSSELFVLFGDPAMPLPIPADTVSAVTVAPDTLVTLGTAVFQGQQSFTSGSALGWALLRDADRAVTRQYTISSQTEQLAYILPGPTLFRGQFSLTGNHFEGRLRIPKDISYSSEPGKLILYLAADTEPVREALGVRTGIYFIGGAPTHDTEGPLIGFETVTGRILQNGDHFAREEGFLIRLQDPLGINLTGEVGHGIEVVDLETGARSDVTGRFLYDLNSITSGTVTLDPEPGQKLLHLQVKAWDSANNSRQVSLKLSLSDSRRLRLFNVLNYPNPFSRDTKFVFEVTGDAEVTVDIYTLDGRRIRSLPGEHFPAGYHFITWDGQDAWGGNLANGVYLYRVQADDGNHKVMTIGKLAKYR